jgi:hypothetical protein
VCFLGFYYQNSLGAQVKYLAGLKICRPGLLASNVQGSREWALNPASFFRLFATATRILRSLACIFLETWAKLAGARCHLDPQNGCRGLTTGFPDVKIEVVSGRYKMVFVCLQRDQSSYGFGVCFMV